jgi:hypothetical protein
VYPMLMILHSWVRWAVLALGLLAVASVARSGPKARRRAVPFVIALDVQLILGALLWVVYSPLTRDLTAAGLRSPEIRRFAAEHPALGLLAVVLAHGANLMLKRDRGGPGVALLAAALLAAATNVPWARPLLRI